MTTNVNWGDSSISSKQWKKSDTYTTFKHKYSINLSAVTISVDNTIRYFEYRGNTAGNAKLAAIEQFGSNITELTSDFIRGSNITSIVVPATVKSIANGAFNNCEKLNISNINSQNGIIVGKSWLVHNGTLVNVLQNNTVTDFNAANIT